MQFENLQPLMKGDYPAIQICDPVEVLSCEQEGRQGGSVTFYRGYVVGESGEQIKCTFASKAGPVPIGPLCTKCAVKNTQYGTDYTFWPSDKQQDSYSHRQTPQASKPSSTTKSIERQTAFKGVIELVKVGKIELTQVESYTDAFADILAGTPTSAPETYKAPDTYKATDDDVPF